MVIRVRRRPVGVRDAVAEPLVELLYCALVDVVVVPVGDSDLCSDCVSVSQSVCVAVYDSDLGSYCVSERAPEPLAVHVADCAAVDASVSQSVCVAVDDSHCISDCGAVCGAVAADVTVLCNDIAAQCFWCRRVLRDAAARQL